MKIIITGGTGFLGSALVRLLLNEKHDIYILSRPMSNLARLKDKILHPRLQIACLSEEVDIKDWIKKIKPDLLVHTACAYGRSSENNLTLFDTNIRLGMILLNALDTLGYPVTFINTGTVLESNASSYALSKSQFSAWGKHIVSERNNQIQFINIKLQHMYGPNDDISKFTTYVIHNCYKNEPVLKLTLGEQQRDFIYIDDVTSVYSILIEKRQTLDKYSEIEVGSGYAPTIREYVQIAHRLTQSKTELRFGAISYRENEPMHCQANIEKLVSLGWMPQTDLQTGILKTINMDFSE
jgi:nucleoside-diphosphate-sugar epimerase